MAKASPMAKRRPQESHWAYRSRMIREKQEERDRDNPIVSPFAARHYVAEDVMHVELGTRAPTYRRRSASSLAALHDAGKLTNYQIEAAGNITAASRLIRGEVAVRGSSVEARVDCSGSVTQALVEHIRQAHLARAYRRWWASGTRVPRAMLLEMIVQDAALKQIARRYRVGWPRALRMLGQSLDTFNEMYERVTQEIDQRDLEAVHYLLMRAA